MPKGFGFVDSSSILKNNLQADTTTADNITDLQTRADTLETENETLRSDVDTLISQMTELRNLLNLTNAVSPGTE
jgi:chaperonin cofactor prefoldin